MVEKNSFDKWTVLRGRGAEDTKDACRRSREPLDMWERNLSFTRCVFHSACTKVVVACTPFSTSTKRDKERQENSTMTLKKSTETRTEGKAYDEKDGGPFPPRSMVAKGEAWWGDFPYPR